LGTRLRPVTYHRPKPLVPVANRPFLEYQVALLKQYGIDDIVFATNYMADKIEGHFGDGSRFGVRMRYAIEESPLGTGGAIRNAADRFPGEAVAVFNGDVLTDFDLGRILDFHREKQAVATITLSEVPSPNPFGVLLLDAEGKVDAWNEPSEATKKLLARIPECSVVDLDAGCCGMAGSFGYSKDHYDVSVAIANRKLLPAVRAMKAGEALVAVGTSCRHQVADLAGSTAVHPAVLIRGLLEVV